MDNTKYQLLHNVINNISAFQFTLTSVTSMSPTTSISPGQLYTNNSSSILTTTFGCPIIPSLKQFEVSYSKVHAYLACTVCLFGIGTNLLNSIILTQKQMRNPTNALLTGIAIVASLTMLVYGYQVVYLHFLTSPYPDKYPHSQLAVYLILLNHTISIGSHTVSTCLLVQLAGFRCWVLYSTKVKQALNLHNNMSWMMISSQKRFIIYCYISSGIIGCLLSMPTFIVYQCELIDVLKSSANNNVTGTLRKKEYNTRLNDDIFENSNDAVTSTAKTSNNTITKNQYFYWFKLRHGGQYLEHLHFIVYGCFVKILASVLIVIFTAFILVVLRDARQRYRKLQSLSIDTKIDDNNNKTINNYTTDIDNNRNVSNITFTRKISGNQLQMTRNAFNSKVITRNSESICSNYIHDLQMNSVNHQVNTKNLLSTLPKITKSPLLLHLSSMTPSNDLKNIGSKNPLNTVNRQPNRLSQKSRESQRVTIMLIIIVISFVITEAPQGVFNTLVAVKGECFLNTIYLPLGDLLDLLVLLNSSINFILYCAMSQMFRMNFTNLLKKLFCC